MSTALVLVAAASPAPTSLGNPGDNPNHVGPGAVAFWIVIALGVGLFLLIKSMGRQMKRIDFDDGSGPAPGPAGADSGDPDLDRDARRRAERYDTIPAVPPVLPDRPVSPRRPPKRR